MTDPTERVPDLRIPLVWRGEAGYQCPWCSLYVAVPKRASGRSCPRCPSLPVAEVAETLLNDAGFDETDAGNAIEALEPLLDGLVAQIVRMSHE